jgi:hypothetical protein
MLKLTIKLFVEITGEDKISLSASILSSTILFVFFFTHSIECEEIEEIIQFSKFSILGYVPVNLFIRSTLYSCLVQITGNLSQETLSLDTEIIPETGFKNLWSLAEYNL